MPIARLVIVEDHDLTARGIEFVLDSRDDLQVIEHLKSGPIVQRLVELAPDILILDLFLPEQSGFAILESAKAALPAMRVVVNSGQGAALEYQRALDLGAEALVAKIDPPECLLEAIDSVLRGRTYRSPDVRQRLRLDSALPTQPALTPRELEVLHLLASGRSSRSIAEALAISELTVKKHRENMARKLGVHTAIEMTRAAQRLGLIRVEAGPD